MKAVFACAAYGRPGEDLASRYHIGATNIRTWVAIVSSGLSTRHAPSHAFHMWIVLCLFHASLVEKLTRRRALSPHVDRVDVGIWRHWDLRCHSRGMFHVTGVRSTGSRTRLGIAVGTSSCSCSCVLVSCRIGCPFLSSCVCGVHRCPRCDLLWDRLVDVGHITRITAQCARCQCACRVMRAYACHSTTAHVGGAVLVRGKRGHLGFSLLQGGSLLIYGAPSTVVLKASFSALLITYVASMSVEISFLSLCLRGTRLASRLYRCLEYHLYHLAPYALTLVYAIRTVFLYAVSGLSSLLFALAATTSAYRHLHAQKMMAASSRPTVSPLGRVPRIHFLLLSLASICRLLMNPATFLQNPVFITGQSTRCSWFSSPLQPLAIHVVPPNPPEAATLRLRCSTFSQATWSLGET